MEGSLESEHWGKWIHCHRHPKLSVGPRACRVPWCPLATTYPLPCAYHCTWGCRSHKWMNRAPAGCTERHKHRFIPSPRWPCEAATVTAHTVCRQRTGSLAMLRRFPRGPQLGNSRAGRGPRWCTWRCSSMTHLSIKLGVDLTQGTLIFNWLCDHN